MHPILSLLIFIPFSLSQPASDAAALLALKSSMTLPVPDPLSAWSVSPSPPCSPSSPSWPFVLCSKSSVITGLRLTNLNLSGSFNASSLTSILSLRSISIVNNNFSGPIPPFSQLNGLKSLYVSNNSFSGEIPDDFFAKMGHLKKLWLDGNSFSGAIPNTISKVVSLIEVRLENNKFSGALPDLNLPALAAFNVSSNDLVGTIPDWLARKFGADSFGGNPGLCGPPVKAFCTDDALIPDNPQEKDAAIKTNILMMISIFLMIGLIIGIIIIKGRRSDIHFVDTLGKHAEAMEAAAVMESSQKQARSSHGSSHRRGGSGSGRRGGNLDLVMVNEEVVGFNLRDLMKAAAEVLGNGGLGSAYKAVMGNGTAVAVKRIKEMNKAGRDVFDVEMRKFGRLRHRNVLTPLAYLYRKDEKLLVSEYVSKGSLLYILHGDHGPDHAALDSPTRLKIIRGIVRGLAYLHIELASLDVPHANLKSGNILLADDYEPLIVDYGFISLVNPSVASNALFAYKSPEALQYRHVSSKSDVYCLGIVILEILTGKFPSQYLNNTKGGLDVVQWTESAIAENKEVELLDPAICEEKPMEYMVKLLRVGATCVATKPEERPEMRETVETVEEIARSSGLVAESEYTDVLVGGYQWQGSKMRRIESSSSLRWGMRRTESVGHGSGRRNGES